MEKAKWDYWRFLCSLGRSELLNEMKIDKRYARSCSDNRQKKNKKRYSNNNFIFLIFPYFRFFPFSLHVDNLELESEAFHLILERIFHFSAIAKSFYDYELYCELASCLSICCSNCSSARSDYVKGKSNFFVDKMKIN